MANRSTVRESEKTFQSIFCDSPFPLEFQKTKVIFRFITLNICLFTTAIVGNFLILVALNKERSLHPPSKLFFRCLAITDFFVGLLSQSLHITFLFTRIDDHLADICVHAAAFAIITSTVCCGLSLMISAAISIDRLLALLLGLRYRHVVTFNRALALVLCFLILNTTIASVSFRAYTFPKHFVWIGLVELLLFVLTSVFCYVKVILAIRQQQNRVQSHLQPNRSRTVSHVARYRKIVSTIVWVQLTLVACYVPFGIVTTVIVASASEGSTTLYTAWEVTTTFVFLKSSLNPILYSWKIREVRQAVKNTIRPFCCFLNQ